ncbi:MAG: UDP-N-acetylmuramate dehydrogenase [Microthrixaceae bacterium]
MSAADPAGPHPVDAPLAFLGSRLRRDESLAPLSTYRVGGAAARFVEVADAVELARIASALVGVLAPEQVLVVGRGSNLLVADEGFDGLALQLGERFAEIAAGDPRHATEGDPAAAHLVRAGGAAALPVVARRTVAAGLTGFEWAVGVPGSIGGAVRMNAGGHGAEMSEVVAGVHVVDLCTGEDVQVSTAALELGYRRSALRPSQVVTVAELSLRAGDRADGERRLSEIVRWRREHQPGGANAGSVFTNPAGDSAGRLIDAAGCKGLRVGGAEVSTKHANFIQADPSGRASDVVEVMRRVVDRVEADSGVRLHAETVLVGFGDRVRAELTGPPR